MKNLLKSPWVAGLGTLIAALIAAYLMLRGSGMFAAPDWGLVLSSAWIILLLSASKKSFYGLMLPLGCIYAFYTPTGLNFGAPSYQYIASVFATDMLETKEFLLQIPLASYVMALAIPILLWAQYRLAKSAKLSFYRNKTFLSLGALLVAFYLPIAQPFKEAVGSTVKIVEEVQKLKAMAQSSDWGTSTLKDSAYQDYVIILGESARKDYLQAYGYPVADTPFMANAKGTLVDGMTSAGSNTVASLRLMLTLPDKVNWEPNYNLTLVDLVKSAGIKTYWLSNQGFLGEFDTPVAALAAKSDETIFLKKGGSFNSTNFSDFDLIPKFAQVLEDKTQGKRFIVLHIYGSHPLACDRVEDYPKIFKEREIDKKYDYLNCYISSIKKTDDFIKKVYETLEANNAKTGRSFSLIYFSDHGLCHQDDEKNGVLLFNQNCHSRLHHNIPLFKLSSDDTQRTEIKAFKSGLNFLEGIAHWIGIENPKLTLDEDLFSDKADSSDYGLEKRINEKYRKDVDAAIDIRPKR